MFWVLSWLVYGLIVGLIVRLFDQGAEVPKGLGPTLLIGVVGSYAGGFIEYLLGRNQSAFSSSGIIMGVVGGVICLYVYHLYHTYANSDNNTGS